LEGESRAISQPIEELELVFYRLPFESAVDNCEFRSTCSDWTPLSRLVRARALASAASPEDATEPDRQSTPPTDSLPSTRNPLTNPSPPRLSGLRGRQCIGKTATPLQQPAIALLPSLHPPSPPTRPPSRLPPRPTKRRLHVREPAARPVETEKSSAARRNRNV